MANQNTTTQQNPEQDVPRRTVLRAAGWTIPAVAAVTAAPAFASTVVCTRPVTDTDAVLGFFSRTYMTGSNYIGPTTFYLGADLNDHGTGASGMPQFFVRSAPAGRPYTVTQLTYTVELPGEYTVSPGYFTAGMGANFTWSFLGTLTDQWGATRYKYQLALKPGVSKSGVSQTMGSQLGAQSPLAPFTHWAFQASPVVKNMPWRIIGFMRPTVTYTYHFTDMESVCDGSSSNPITGVQTRNW